MLLSAGYRNGGMEDQTILFDAETQTWTKYSNYEEGIYGNRLM
jgi:hypothetical protein